MCIMTVPFSSVINRLGDVTSVVPPKEDGNTIKVIKCPLTGDYIEKSKIRKTFFC